MEPTFGSFIRSSMFTFIVGKNKEPIIVHSDAIAKLSPPLNSLINGSMLEAETKVATFADVDPNTFVLFCQFAYVGDYVPPKGLVQLSQKASSDSITETLSKSENMIKKDTSTKSSSNHELDRNWPDAYFDQHFRKLARSSIRSESPYKPIPNSSHNINYVPVFLGHARLYIFADRWGVDELKSLCLGKLHNTLGSFTLYPSRVRDVLVLVRFIYDEENAVTCGELREVLVRYVASKCKIFSGCEEFTQLLSEGGDFVTDFWKTIKPFVIC